jgi:prolyl-tRNA synthetase
VTDGGYIVGANEPDHHLRGVEPGRDFAFERGDVRSIEAGDTIAGHPITIEPAIEVGNIFQLGTRYSEPLGATFLDVDGAARPIWMGSYGIGPARIAAAAVEQFADENGISWPRALAPWDVELVALGKAGSEELAAAESLYRELRAIGLDVLLDDRDVGPGVKFADAELLGCPLRLTVGRRSLKDGRTEAQRRRGREDVEGGVPLDRAGEAVAELWRSLP